MSITPGPAGRRHARHLTTLAVGLAAATALAGCNLSSSGSKTDEVKSGSLAKSVDLKGTSVTVGGKEFTEQLILCQITSQALTSVGAKVTEKCGLNGSNTVRDALTAGSIDLYWEYTGTAWIGYLKHTTPIDDATKQYDAVAKEDKSKNKITWLDPAPYNSTYAIVANGEVAKKYGVKTLSDFAKLAKANPAVAKTCGASEFLARNDGWPGLQKAYGFTLPSADLATIAEGAIYNAVGKGKTCNFGEGDTTDGRIAALHLTVLQDDKGFFPVYNPAVTIRSSVLKKHPDLAKALNPIAAKLDLSTMQQLDAKVDIDGDKPEDVAHDWLKSKDFIG